MLAIGFPLLDCTNRFVGCAELITVKTPKKHMDVKLGENALLECTFETNQDTTSRLSFSWDFAASTSISPKQVHTHTHTHLYRRMVVAQALHLLHLLVFDLLITAKPASSWI